MSGLFGALDMGARSLRTHRQGVEIAGQNLANVNNTAYARQRLHLQTSLPLPTSIGPQGSGVEAVAIQQIRDHLLDRRVRQETSISGFLTAQQRALEDLQGGLGEQFDSQAVGAGGIAGAGGSSGLATTLNRFFAALQGLSTAPASITERQNVLAAAEQLTSRFHLIDSRLKVQTADLNEAVKGEVAEANTLLESIAMLNRQIRTSETATGAVANDLRDLRQQKVEELAKFVGLDTASDADGNFTVSVAGQVLVAGKDVTDRLEAYDRGGGQLLLRLAAAGNSVVPGSGSIQGMIEARDGALSTLGQDLNQLASALIAAVNTVHQPGYNLKGGTGLAFFTGTGAANIAVNPELAGDPSLLQASGQAGAVGDNAVALKLAQLQDQAQDALGQLTFAGSYGQAVGAVGQALGTVNSRLSDQQVLQKLLETQRSSVSGVSIDEEMTDMMKYEKAFQASAKLISTLSDMLDEIVNLKR